ncbi:ATP-binding protein [uncultured Desulfuromusa sp.]|uniref:ATP-binding protein n=1 Tax=uncultured Desulfuromusa sp. TaxID=219183 RepID=UPI002AA7C448|nr:ATP-binding protein [uncultured Desulfuromusa sp.]
MKHAMAMTKNLRLFMSAVDHLMNREIGTEGMGLLWGDPGQGKSTAVAYVVNAMDGIYVRAIGSWTVTSMLGTIATELGGHRMLRRADMIDFICQRLGQNPRPIFIDEADYLFRQVEMLDSLRDIYDLSGCPVVLVGMEQIARKLQNHGRFARRITEWVEFKGIDLDDTMQVTRDVCEIDVADGLLEHLHNITNGNIGRIIIGLSKIEKMGKANGIDCVTLEQWGDRPLYYDQPTFTTKKTGG